MKVLAGGKRAVRELEKKLGVYSLSLFNPFLLVPVPPEVQPEPDRRRRPGALRSPQDPPREVAEDQRGRAPEHRLLPGLVSGVHRQVGQAFLKIPTVLIKLLFAPSCTSSYSFLRRNNNASPPRGTCLKTQY